MIDKLIIEKLEKNIRFTGYENEKIDAINFVDEALKKYGDFGVYGDLSSGLEELVKDKLIIEITLETTNYFISIYPENTDLGGHDFSFSIDKETGLISDVAVGEIEPPPLDSDDEYI